MLCHPTAWWSIDTFGLTNARVRIVWQVHAPRGAFGTGRGLPGRTPGARVGAGPPGPPPNTTKPGRPPRPGSSPDVVEGYMIPTTCPSGSAKRAIVVSGATSVSGMITVPPLAETLSRTACGLSVWT